MSNSPLVQDSDACDDVSSSSHAKPNDQDELRSRAGEADRVPGELPCPKTSAPQPTTQPSVVGESWYASYVMRGFAPGHASFHRPIDDCNETVSRDARKEIIPKRPQLPQEKSTLSDLPPPNIMDRLIKVYFERFHAFCPILGRKSFFASLHDGTVSGTLLRSVLFVASLHCDLEVIYLMGHSNRLDANDELFIKASTSFDGDRESNRNNMILSSYLLHYWFGNPTAYRDMHWWLAAAIRSAQCMGYHRSTSNTQMPPQERSRWKRIWWCLYVSFGSTIRIFAS